MTTFGDILFDHAQNHLYVSGGSGSSVLYVMTPEGEVVKKFTTLLGPMGMYVDGSTLYVALSNGNMVQKIDTETLEKTGVINLGPGGAQPRWIAKAGGLLWVVTKCEQFGSSYFSIDPTTGAVAREAVGVSYCPWITSSPALPNHVFAFEAGLSPGSIYKFKVEDGDLVAEDSSWHAGESSNMQELAISPDGETLYSAAGAPYHINSFYTDDLSEKGTYITRPYPTAVTASSDGTLIAGGCNCHYDDDIDVFPVDSAEPSLVYDLPPETGDLLSRGLEFSTNGETLFAVSGDWDDEPVYLHVLDNVKLAPSQMTLEASHYDVLLGETITLTGNLTFPEDEDQPAGEVVQVYGTPTGGTSTLLGTTTLDENGFFEFDHEPDQSILYKAVWNGDGSHRPAAARVAVDVEKPPGNLVLEAGESIIPFGTSTTLTVTLGEAAETSNDHVKIYSRSGAGEHLAAEGDVDDAGVFSVELSPQVSTSYVAEWAGDDRHRPTTSARELVRVRVRTSGRLLEHTGQSDGHMLYHGDVDPIFKARVYPAHDGEPIVIHLEERSALDWDVLESKRLRLNTNSRRIVVIERDLLEEGVSYRVRAIFEGDGDHAEHASRGKKFKLID